MGDLIQLFRDTVQTEEQAFDEDHLSEGVRESMVEVMSDLDGIFDVATVAEFREVMASVKTRVAEWPDG